MNKLMKKAALPAAVLMVLTSQQVFATNGMAPHGTGITQKAMGGASTATALNTMNGGSNPASFANIEDGWDIGADLFSPDRGAKISGNSSPPGAGDGSYDGNDSNLFLIPEGGYKKSIGNKSAVGVVVYANGGMNTDYKTPIPNFGSSNAGIDLQQLIIAPTWAIKAGEDHSFGVSLNLAYQTFEATGLENFTAPLGSPQNQSTSPDSVTNNGKDSSTGIGFTVGWQGKVSENVVLGASYRSKTNMSKFDKYKGLFAEQGDLDMPAAINIGVAWQATPNTLIAADAMQIKYSKVAAIGNVNPTGPLGGDNGSGFGWKDQNIFKIGVKQKLNSKVAVLAGYNHGSAPISESQTFFNVLAPATVEDHLTLGLEYGLSDKSKITAAYMHAFGNEIKGSGSIGTPSGGGEADIEMSQNSIGLAYSKKF